MTVSLRWADGVYANKDGIGVQFQCVPELLNIQELFKSLRNKNISNGTVYTLAEKENI